MAQTDAIFGHLTQRTPIMSKLIDRLLTTALVLILIGLGGSFLGLFSSILGLPTLELVAIIITIPTTVVAVALFFAAALLAAVEP